MIIKIPSERIAVLIGKKGSTKKKLEKLTSAKINIDSSTGEVSIEKNNADPYTYYKLEMLVKAVGRGFSPEKALWLLEENYIMHIENIKDYARTEKSRNTKRSRLIGHKGSVRSFIEKDTNCFVSIYGKTVSIIGKEPALSIAVEAVKKILSGAEIPAVRRYVERAMRSLNSDFYE